MRSGSNRTGRRHQRLVEEEDDDENETIDTAICGENIKNDMGPECEEELVEENNIAGSAAECLRDCTVGIPSGASGASELNVREATSDRGDGATRGVKRLMSNCRRRLNDCVQKRRAEWSTTDIGKLRFAPKELMLIFSAKLAECVAYYGIGYIFITYLSEDFGFTDNEAGVIYAIYGLLCTVFGFLGGFIIDMLGVHRSLLIGTTMATLSRMIAFWTMDKGWMKVSQMLIAPFGAAFGIPVMAISVRRFTHKDYRAYGFSFFYLVLNLGCIIGTGLINVIRGAFPDGYMLGDFHLSWMRIVVGVCTLFSAYTVVVAFMIGDFQVRSDRPVEERVFSPTPKPTGSGLQFLRESASSPAFWRLLALTGVFCGVRTIFRHLDATFPKYFVRLFGKDAPFELVVSINPIMTTILSPIMTGILLNLKADLPQIFIYGSMMSGISVFAMAFSESVEAAVIFVTVLSLGEAIWSPKLYEFSTMAAPEGREGIFVSLTFAPTYLASFFTGFISGWALTNYCPKNPEDRDTRLMWFIIGCIGFMSPVLLFVFKPCLFKGAEAADGADGQDVREIRDDIVILAAEEGEIGDDGGPVL